MKIILRLLLLSVGYFLLMGMSEKKEFSERNQDKIDSIYFSYFSHIYEEIISFDFKIYKDTLFVYRYNYNYESKDLDYVFCQKTVNQDTVEFIKEFVCLFITDKTEKIILKEKDDDGWATSENYPSILIRAYTNGKITHNKRIIMNPEREYHPKFLQLCDMFLSIARGTR